MLYILHYVYCSEQHSEVFSTLLLAQRYYERLLRTAHVNHVAHARENGVKEPVLSDQPLQWETVSARMWYWDACKHYGARKYAEQDKVYIVAHHLDPLVHNT